ncbi:MAG: Glutarate-semialdehyde dehydrogenase DavD [candidate division BRC1 bacterium ADurb.BinA364]|nr:MAG: Glutarate-semialdehyde dehydrogenase DavD [candidate division BRC1 bacterium ADurb.BinA364]
MRAAPYLNYVGGDLLDSAQRIAVENPATEEPCGRYASYTADILDRALAEAQAAFRSWSATPIGERSAWMKKLAGAIEARRDEVIGTLVAETGKPQDNAEYDYGMLVTCLNFFAEEILRLRGEIIPDAGGGHVHQLIRHPVGVVVGYLAWNFPLLNVGYKIGPALAAGCTCIIKPSSTTPLATALIGEIMHSIAFPKGVVNIVMGKDREISRRLVESPIPAMITMIGSTEAGCRLIRDSATSIKKYSLELGGNAPVIVYPDFDPQLAAERTVGLKLANSGQVCVSPNRCFVHDSIFDAFIDAAKAQMAKYHFGAGRGPEPLMGPMMFKGHLDDMLEKIARARSQGAQIVFGGERPSRDLCPQGHFLQPTLALCDRSIDLCVEEIFGPILPVIRFGSDDDVVAWANESRYGLASYVFTNDLEAANACAERLEYGSICINEPWYSVELPHGGLKQSGIGKDCSHLSLEEYFDVKRVTIKRERRAFAG